MLSAFVDIHGYEAYEGAGCYSLPLACPPGKVAYRRPFQRFFWKREPIISNYFIESQKHFFVVIIPLVSNHRNCQIDGIVFCLSKRPGGSASNRVCSQSEEECNFLRGRFFLPVISSPSMKSCTSKIIENARLQGDAARESYDNW